MGQSLHRSQTDQRALFARCAVQTAPGAALLLTSGNEAGRAIGMIENEAPSHGSIDAEEYRSLLAQDQLVNLAQIPNAPNCGGRSVCLPTGSIGNGVGMGFTNRHADGITVEP